MQTTASEVTPGDFLDDLDNGYVFEVEDDATAVLGYNAYGSSLPMGMVLISFHDAEGEENHLILNPDHPLNITEGEAI